MYDETSADLRAAVMAARGASYLFVKNITEAALGVVAFAIIARILSQSEMGLMVVLLLVLELSQIAVNLGFPSVITKFTAESMGRREYGTAFSIIRLSLETTLILAILAGLALVTLGHQLSTFLTKSDAYTGTFILLGMAVAVGSLRPILSASLLGLQRTKELAMIDTARFIIQQTLAIAMLLLGWGLHGVVIGWTVGYVFYGAAGTILVLDVSSKSSPANTFSLRKLLGSSWPLYATQYVEFASSRFDRALLIAYAPLAMLGVYNVAYAAFGVLAVLLGGMATALFPHYSEIAGRNGPESLKTAVRVASRYVALIGTPLTLGLAVTAAPVLSLFGGRAYEPGANTLGILSLFLGSTVIYYAIANLLVVLNRVSQASASTIMSILTSLVAAGLLVPELGLEGMAVARGVGMVTALVATVYFARKAVNFEVDGQAIWKSAVASIVMALLVLVLERLFYNRYLLPLYAIAGVAIYVLMIKMLRVITRFDLELAKTFAGKKWAKIIEKVGILLLG